MRACQVFQYWDEVEKLVVVRVAEPAADRNGVLWMEYIAGGRVVDDDGLTEVTANLAQVLHVIALMVVTALSEQSVVHNMVNVQLIQ